jgi:chromosome segregation ATPase
MGEDRPQDIQKLEQALKREFPEKAPESVECGGERYVHERLVNMYLQANPAERRKLAEERQALEARRAGLDEREKYIKGMEGDVEGLRRRLDEINEELAAAHEELRQYKYGDKADGYNGKEKGTEIQKVIVNTTDLVADLEDDIVQKDQRIAELEAEVERLMRENADS